MKKILKISLFVGLLFGVLQAAAQTAPNYPLPQYPDTLRILGVGNSFTDDGMMYLPELLEAAGIHNVVLGRLYIGGCSLERHCKEYNKEVKNYTYYKSTDNKWVKKEEKVHMTYGLTDEKWDIFVIQQKSGISGIYGTFQPWLDKLVEIIRWNGRNAGACIAWQQTWAYSSNSDHGSFPSYGKKQMLMYKCIVSAVEKVLEDTTIETVIPSGTAIQNMRATEFCDPQEFTRDGYHLSHGAGRYTAACTWFQTLIAPCLGTTVAGNPCTLKGSKHELTPELAKACQEAARRACIRPLSVWE